jgi:hypothetical protein
LIEKFDRFIRDGWRARRESIWKDAGTICSTEASGAGKYPQMRRAKSNLWSSCRKYQGASALKINRYILTGNHYHLQIEIAKANLRIREYAVEKDDAFYDIIDCAAFATGCRCQPVLASAKVASAGLRNEFQYSPCSAY